MPTNQLRATPTVSEANGRIRLRVRQGARMLVAVVSIVIVCTCVFSWMRSYVVGDKSYRVSPRWAVFCFEIGTIEWREDRGYAFLCLHDEYRSPNNPSTKQRHLEFLMGTRRDEERVWLQFDILRWDFESRRHFGFGVDRRDTERYFDHQGNFGMRAAAIRAPLWFPTMLGLLTAFLALRALRRDWYATAPTRCRTCGYDLRAGHDKCPECGGESHVPAKSVVD